MTAPTPTVPTPTPLTPAAGSPLRWALTDTATLAGRYLTHLRQEQRVCLFGSLAAEFRTLPETMQRELRLFNQELTEWLAEVLAAGRASGTLVFRGEPLAKAAQVLSTLAGALQVARVHDEKHFYLVFDQLRSELLPE